MIDKALALRAIETHGTIFFDIDLQPVVPQPGQWFCEFDDQYLPEDSETLRDEAIVEETLMSHLLKSNCLVTNQPDWASIQIRYLGRRIEREGLPLAQHRTF